MSISPNISNRARAEEIKRLLDNGPGKGASSSSKLLEHIAKNIEAEYIPEEIFKDCQGSSKRRKFINTVRERLIRFYERTHSDIFLLLEAIGGTAGKKKKEKDDTHYPIRWLRFKPILYLPPMSLADEFWYKMLHGIADDKLERIIVLVPDQLKFVAKTKKFVGGVTGLGEAFTCIDLGAVFNATGVRSTVSKVRPKTVDEINRPGTVLITIGAKVSHSILGELEKQENWMGVPCFVVEGSPQGEQNVVDRRNRRRYPIKWRKNESVDEEIEEEYGVISFRRSNDNCRSVWISMEGCSTPGTAAVSAYFTSDEGIEQLLQRLWKKRTATSGLSLTHRYHAGIRFRRSEYFHRNGLADF